MRITSHCLTMVKESTNSVEFIYCGCGCGFTRSKYNKWGIERKFIPGHENRGRYKGKNNPFYGKHHDEETRKIMSKVIIGELNPNYRGLHKRIRKLKPKLELCELCNKAPSLDLANVSGEYLNDLDDWLYLCRDCHKFFDAQMFMSRLEHA